MRVHDLSVPGNLSRVSWKLSRTVLRGGTNRKVGPLLDRRNHKSMQPYCFEVNDGELFAFASLWDRWKDPSGQWVKIVLDPDDDSERCDIVRSRPNASHPRSETATTCGSIRE